MSDTQNNEPWQVEVSGQIYEASFGELAEWIADGALLPQDKVRRGNLRWVEAGRVPRLNSFFNAKSAGRSLTISTSAGTGNLSDPLLDAARSSNIRNSTEPAATDLQPGNLIGPSADREGCMNHPDRAGAYKCLSCQAAICRECVKKFGSNVTLCSVCGGMCKPMAELEITSRRHEFLDSSIKIGFGVQDFVEAIAYPFRFKFSLAAGAAMFAFFSLGRTASSVGGMYMQTASIASYMLANMLVFGILSNTVGQFAHGKIGGNFMPDFDDFSLWDDVVHPFFLSLGVWISSFGAFAAVLLAGSYLVLSSVNSEMDTFKSNLENTPGTPYYNARNTIDQSQQVRSVLGNTERLNRQGLEKQEEIVGGDRSPEIAQDVERDVQDIDKMIADGQRKELESVVGKTPETRQRESAAFVAGLLKLAAPIAVIGFITFLWGLLYFPAACIVAGYTKSFSATINPLVGLDTARRLRFDYIKILLMTLFLVVGFGIVSFVIELALSPFDLPGIGNLPAGVLESIIWFYLSIVFACLLGYALFKASDRLRLST